MKTVVERFLEYVSFDTKSDPDSETCPSTKKQLKLAEYLYNEMKEIGLTDVSMKDGYVYGTLKGDESKKTIGFVSHMDTSPDFSGKNVKPQFVENYDGKDIKLNNEVYLKVEDFPELEGLVGKTIITTDGTTLLGADDKAGIAEIMTAMEYLIHHDEIKHGTVKVGFTPDEEIGRGADKFDVEGFNADFAYTVDGGHLGGIEYENFNAAGAKVVINGRNIHPGHAKNKMKNAVVIGNELISMLPEAEKPEHTELYEGFYHVNDFNGNVEKAELIIIIRDHDMEKFNHRKEVLTGIVELLNTKYGKGTVELDLSDSYYNMYEKVKEEMHIVETAIKAMEELNITPIVEPIRGGTDGSRLSYMGLISPNLFTGGANFHGKYEYVVKESMEASVQVILKIIELYAK